MATKPTGTRKGKKSGLDITPKVLAGPFNGHGSNGGPGITLARPLIIQTEPKRDVRNFAPQHKFNGGLSRGLGWLRDLPDVRDGTIVAPPQAGAEADDKQQILHEKAVLGIAKRMSAPAKLQSKVDNRSFCSPIEDQQQLGSCTAQSCVGLVEYMERRASGRHIEGSRLFLYKMTRKLMGWDGDTGAFLRSTMKALVLFGLPPEEWWPYDIDTFENEPDPFLYAYALNCKALKYVRLDPSDTPTNQVLQNVKAAIAAGFAAMFGFAVYDSLDDAADIPYPRPTDRQRGGHAVLCVGYDDDRPCRNSEKGALLIRNSWGTEWGDAGYGWLPYQYVTRGLANDFWTCYQLDWIDSHQFD